MNNTRLIQLVMPVILSLILLSPVTFADNHSPQVLSETWVMTPKVGHSADMRDALKKYSEYRKTLEDPREWSFYSPILGNRIDLVAVRSFGFSWADMDSFREWRSKNDSQKNFNENVDQFVSSYGHYMSVIDAKNTHWGTEVKYRYVGVTSYMVKAGHRTAMEADKKLFSDAAKANDWPFNWEWSDSVSGRDTLQLAVPYQSWANMAPPETEFAALLAKHLGSEAEAKIVLERWTSHFSSTEYNVWGLREDLM